MTRPVSLETAKRVPRPVADAETIHPENSEVEEILSYQWGGARGRQLGSRSDSHHHQLGSMLCARDILYDNDVMLLTQLSAAHLLASLHASFSNLPAYRVLLQILRHQLH